MLAIHKPLEIAVRPGTWNGNCANISARIPVPIVAVNQFGVNCRMTSCGRDRRLSGGRSATFMFTLLDSDIFPIPPSGENGLHGESLDDRLQFHVCISRHLAQCGTSRNLQHLLRVNGGDDGFPVSGLHHHVARQ